MAYYACILFLFKKPLIIVWVLRVSFKGESSWETLAKERLLIAFLLGSPRAKDQCFLLEKQMVLHIVFVLVTFMSLESNDLIQ